MIIGARIRQVRELKGWTQHELAAMLQVSQPFVAHMESGTAKVPSDVAGTLVFKTGFPLSFFESESKTDFPLGSLLFRAHADMRADEQRAVHRHAELAFEIVCRMLSSRLIREVPIKVPRVSERDPEHAAQLARSELGLSADSPVKHMIATMEGAGIIVIVLPRSFIGGDAFSAWVFDHDGQRRPVVVLSSDRPADRVRMNAAHELGHLVMHQQVSRPASELETEAKAFASAFLLPAEAMRQAIVEPMTLDTFLNLKLIWGTAVQALIVRAASLGLITPRRYKSLMQRVSARGWRKTEPLSSQIPLERPRAFRQIAEMIYGPRIDYGRLAADVRFPEAFVRELIQGHAGKAAATTESNEPPLVLDVNLPNALLLFPKREDAK